MFKNRQQAGQLLADKIVREIKILDIEVLRDKFVILGIPRGGVVVANAVAKKLGCPLDVIVVKKIGAPGQEELAIGAVGETPGSVYLNNKLIGELGVKSDYLEEIKKLKNLEIKEREKLYRQNRLAFDLEGKTVIIVDDGAATGATVIVAAREVWNNEPQKVIVALPVVAKDTLAKLEKEADEVIFLETPELFYAVGQFYEEFGQVGEEEVMQLLASSC